MRALPRSYPEIVGAIYDCALDPAHWQPVVHEIMDLLACRQAFLRLDDLTTRRTTISASVGVEAEGQARHETLAAEVMGILVGVLAGGHPVLRPTVASQVLTPEALDATRYASEWGRPHGLVDYMGLFLLNSPTRMATLELGRHERHGCFTPAECDLAAAFIPHLRRAMTISNAINAVKIERDRLAETLDALPLGVVLADEASKIVHANTLAESMLGTGTVVRKQGNRLRAGEGRASAEVSTAIKLAARNDTEIGRKGIAVRLTAESGPPIVAHVLPLGGGEARSRLDPEAVAAVFINPNTDDDARVRAMSVSFGLTRAETAVLAQILSGQTLAHAAEHLGIAVSTTKTHLNSIFHKTGTSRQVDLILLAARMSPTPP